MTWAGPLTEQERSLACRQRHELPRLAVEHWTAADQQRAGAGPDELGDPFLQLGPGASSLEKPGDSSR
jgi:hypothetical protein